MGYSSLEGEYALVLLPEHADVLSQARKVYDGIFHHDFLPILDHAEVARRLAEDPSARPRVEASLQAMAGLLEPFAVHPLSVGSPQVGPDGIMMADAAVFLRDQEALELYSRIAMSQLEEIARHPAIERRAVGLPFAEWDDLRNGLEEQARLMRASLFPGLAGSSYYGIGSRAIGNEARLAWDLQQVLRHRLAWDAAGNPSKRIMPDMIQVMYDEPMGWSGRPMPTFERLETEQVPAPMHS